MRTNGFLAVSLTLSTYWMKLARVSAREVLCSSLELSVRTSVGLCFFSQELLFLIFIW